MDGLHTNQCSYLGYIPTSSRYMSASAPRSTSKTRWKCFISNSTEYNQTRTKLWLAEQWHYGESKLTLLQSSNAKRCKHYCQYLIKLDVEKSKYTPVSGVHSVVDMPERQSKTTMPGWLYVSRAIIAILPITMTRILELGWFVCDC